MACSLERIFTFTDSLRELEGLFLYYWPMHFLPEELQSMTTGHCIHETAAYPVELPFLLHLPPQVVPVTMGKLTLVVCL